MSKRYSTCVHIYLLQYSLPYLILASGGDEVVSGVGQLSRGGTEQQGVGGTAGNV